MKLKIGKEIVKRLEKELNLAQRLNNNRLYRRVLAMLLIAKEKKAEFIAEIINVSVRTVFRWLERFMWERFNWLSNYHYKGRGRKPKLNKVQKKKLYGIINKGPEEYGFDCGLWNSAMILEVIIKEFKVIFNPRYLCTMLKKMGLSYQRAWFESDRLDDKKHKDKRKEWDEVIWPGILEKAKKFKGVILFEDEVSSAQWGSLARTWAPKGRQPVVKTGGKRKGLKMFGAIEFDGGGFEYSECDDKFNGASYIVFLKQVLKKYSCPVLLIEDGAPYHGAWIVKEFKNRMERENRLFTYRQPSYSPDKNPIEKLWKNTKRDATHLKYFPTFEDLRKSVVGAFEKYLNDATKVICVMKKLRTESGIA
ncbi:IS630 family transposase [Desulfococcaceae bacterium HSG7]|nr:IS630 family transposase [Desulfococcaceae bacterium HSG7]